MNILIFFGDIKSTLKNGSVAKNWVELVQCRDQ
jgi:hypothetical protein